MSKNSYRFELISVHKCPFLGLDFYYIFVISKKSRLASKKEKTYGVVGLSRADFYLFSSLKSIFYGFFFFDESNQYAYSF